MNQERNIVTDKASVDPASSRHSLELSTRQFLRWQFSLIGLVLFSGLAAYTFTAFTGYGSLLGTLRLFDVGDELSFPSLFSVANLGLAALLTAWLWRCPPGPEGRRAWGWLALVMLFLALDEGAGIHETFNTIQTHLAAEGLTPAWFASHPWLVLGAPLALIVGALFLPFLLRMPRRLAAHLVGAGSLFLGGAVGMEAVGAEMESSGVDREAFIYDMRRLLEEGLEMSGIAWYNITIWNQLALRRARLAVLPQE